MLYRCGDGDCVWHFCRNCEGWPTMDYREQVVEPPRAALCAACIAKNEQLECEAVPPPGAS
jgi:hypothetical protein